jgi:hypothetical protein
MKADIAINTGFGAGLFLIQAVSPGGLDWMSDHLPDADQPGLAYCDQTAYTQNIAQGATNDGIAVAVDGYLYLDGGLRGEKIE